MSVVLRPKMASLELVRGLAALEVFVDHLLQLPDLRERFQWLVPLSNFATEAVVLFFVLSGTVIRIALERSGWQLGHFVRARLVRILPVYLIALAVAAFAQWRLGDAIDPVQYGGHLLFLQTIQGQLVFPVSTNLPLWSLSYEMFFYAVTALVLALTRSPAPGRGWTAWALLAGAAALSTYVATPGGFPGYAQTMLAMSASWLLGFHAPELGRRLRPTAAQAAVFLALIPLVSRLPTVHGYYAPTRFFLLAALTLPLILHLRATGEGEPPRPLFLWTLAAAVFAIAAATLVTSDSLPSSKRIYTLLPLGVLLVARPAIALGQWFVRTGERWILEFGRSSYCLYAVHFPILALTRHAFDRWLPQLVVPIVAVGLLVWVAEFGIQPWIARRVAAPRPAA